MSARWPLLCRSAASLHRYTAHSARYFRSRRVYVWDRALVHWRLMTQCEESVIGTSRLSVLLGREAPGLPAADSAAALAVRVDDLWDYVPPPNGS